MRCRSDAVRAAGLAQALLIRLSAGMVLGLASAGARAEEAPRAAAALPAGGFIAPAGPVAAAQLDHFWVITGIMLLVVVPIFILVPLVVMRYRRGGRGAYRPDWDFNWGVETVIWGIPIAIIVALSVALWKHTHQYDPYQALGEDPMPIEVVSLDWKFVFLYPEQGVATVDELVLPQNRPVTLTLTSGTVMQSFMVPQLAGQIYTMAGMKTQLNLIADTPGAYVGRNTQYNGTGFADQSFRTLVMPDADLDVWFARARASDRTLDWAGYETLLQPALVPQPIVYGSYEPGLFARIVDTFAPGMGGHGRGHGAGATAPPPADQGSAAHHGHGAGHATQQGESQ